MFQLCFFFLFINSLFFPPPDYFQHSSMTMDPVSNHDHDLVSSSLTIATVPLLVLTRSHSKSSTSVNLDDEKCNASGSLNFHKSDSGDSLNLGNITSSDNRSVQGIPRIIVISPTSESSLISQDNVCLEESIEAMESNVFVSLNFSSEVFEAVELLSWPNWTSNNKILNYFVQLWTQKTHRVETEVLQVFSSSWKSKLCLPVA